MFHLGWMLALSAVAWPCSAAPERADVVVYGGTSGGVVAAVQAARMGKQVVLIESGRHLGGMTSGGLGVTDNGNTGTIGGLSLEFYQRVYAYYTNASSWKYQSRQAFVDWMPATWGVDGPRMEEIRAQFRFEPHAAETVYDDMVREAKVKVVFGERLDLKNGVRKSGARIKSIVMESGREFEAQSFIDATYEGDLLARAGVKYTVGREPNTQYGETLNGSFPFTPRAFPDISPYVVANDPKSGLLPRVEPKPPGPKGSGDRRVQTYNFRLCITDVDRNRVPFEKPAGYNPLDYELLARYLAGMKVVEPGPRPGAALGLRGKADLVLSFNLVPNRKTDSNSGGEFGTDMVGGSYDWAEADYAGRNKLWQEHKRYTQGLLWFLANDPRVHEPIRKEMQRWGLARDEFTDTENWPRQLYVREARRMVSDYVITEHDARGTRRAEDPVALASYPLDSHGVTLYVDEKGVLHRERGFYEGISPFPISYRALRPRAAECENLLVTCAISSSHAAFGSVRMEPVFMMMGQVAGTAASLAIDRKSSVQAVPYAALRDCLLADHQKLHAPVRTASRAKTSSETVEALRDTQLAADVRVLVENGIIASGEYWLRHAKKGQRCSAPEVQGLLQTIAKAQGSGSTLDEVLKTLVSERIINSPDFWKQQISTGRDCPGEHVGTIIRNFVRAHAPAVRTVGP